jgi:hypothetical protein
MEPAAHSSEQQSRCGRPVGLPRQLPIAWFRGFHYVYPFTIAGLSARRHNDLPRVALRAITTAACTPSAFQRRFSADTGAG